MMPPRPKMAATLAVAALLAAGAGWSACHGAPASGSAGPSDTLTAELAADSVARSSADSLEAYAEDTDSLPAADAKTRYTGLSHEDFEIVARELGVEVAAIQAVVDIESGGQMKGFWAPGVPVVNFDRSMYTRFKAKTKSAGDKSAKTPEGLSGYAKREWTQLTEARRVNCDAANLGTFWGMFQIGGFNYKACGCSTVGEMVRRMSHSELQQLELFAAFITNSGMLADLKAKNWAGFARKFNGASYARRGYHTKMANAYAKYKNQQ